LQSSLSDSEWEHFRDELLNRAGKPGVKAGIIDLTAMDVIDSYASRTLREHIYDPGTEQSSRSSQP